MELSLKYGCNPNQTHALLRTPEPSPLTVVNGRPGYINLMDALRGWQLVRDLEAATGKPAAASFKHVSPAGCAVAGELTDSFRASQWIAADEALSPVATAYAKARSSDRVASFGDFIAVSEEVDETLARLIKPEVSDGIIAPGYTAEAREMLAAKKNGQYCMLAMDRDYQPPAIESRTDFGFTLEQSANDTAVSADWFAPDKVVCGQRELNPALIETAIVATVTLKHTQSNSICVAYAGHSIGIGAGQQSRIACTRLACEKADRWLLKLHPRVLALRFARKLPRSEQVNAIEQFIRFDELKAPEHAALREVFAGVVEPLSGDERQQWLASSNQAVLSSDAFIPFRDNVDRAAASGVKLIVQAGGSARDQSVIDACDEHAMAMVMTGVRLFLH